MNKDRLLSIFDKMFPQIPEVDERGVVCDQEKHPAEWHLMMERRDVRTFLEQALEGHVIVSIEKADDEGEYRGG